MNFPQEVRTVLQSRIEKLQSNDFPDTSTGMKENVKLATALLNMLSRDDASKYYSHLPADLAIVASRVAHAMDKDKKGDFVFENDFRGSLYLQQKCSQCLEALETDFVRRLLVAQGEPRSLTEDEKDKFEKWHANARHPDDPLLPGQEMETFLASQKVYELTCEQTLLCGFSSFDGTRIYVLDSEHGVTALHELEHNIRRYVLKNVEQSASLVSPATDRSLKVRGIQCESGFVSEAKNGITVPGYQLGPFSARWKPIRLK